MFSAPVSPRAIVVVVATSLVVFGACSGDQSRGEGYLFLDDNALLLCDSIEPDPARCVEPIFGVDTFLLLDNGAVEMVEQDATRYSLERVELIQTDDEVGFFKAIPLAPDEEDASPSQQLACTRSDTSDPSARPRS